MLIALQTYIALNSAFQNLVSANELQIIFYCKMAMMYINNGLLHFNLIIMNEWHCLHLHPASSTSERNFP